jgi:hypothetical protein
VRLGVVLGFKRSETCFVVADWPDHWAAIPIEWYYWSK